ncbi:anti-sigma regulatory factor (Ser/Thr protein kinase) [Streptomyces sp. V4I23]|uniref:ATP-binding protein n=1 Tax=Streptomyces sp. V4I23 TaxID=3042282 RepID=UPI0027864A7D|nr:ATP-binding protein [Streptomyces sp. V4I23]MDQ1010577.1 anti-sigma regulatory factor (Ser/Thr protein kinase) [Streptomyces sp. V4I23]
MSTSACRVEVMRKSWELPFLAEAAEVATIRRVLHNRLSLWGLPNVVETAQLCVTELVANVIRHVGDGTPATLAVSMSGSCLRIELRDPDSRALPTLLRAQEYDETGRGMALVDAMTERWGVLLRGDSKVTWCELETGLASDDGHIGGESVERAEALLGLCGLTRGLHARAGGPLVVAVAEEVAIDMIADLLLWLRAHGCDPDEALDRAQMNFEAEAAC